MSERCSVVRNARNLGIALDHLCDMRRSASVPPAIENMVLTASFIAGAALRREESRGAHFRNDFPEANPEFAERSYLTLADLEEVGEEFASSAHAEAEPAYAAAP